MQKYVSIFVLFITAFNANISYAENLATCSNPEGHAYYLLHGVIDKQNSGWKEDKISDATFTLQRSKAGFDILFLDATKQIISSKDDGGNVALMSHSRDDAVFIVHYPKGGTVEVYKFFEDDVGQKKFSVSATRTNSMPVVKSSLMVGDCSFIDFGNIK